MHLADTFIQSDLQMNVYSGYTFFVCVFLSALLTQCFTTEPQEQEVRIDLKLLQPVFRLMSLNITIFTKVTLSSWNCIWTI